MQDIPPETISTQHFEMKRAHQYYLPLLGQPRPRPGTIEPASAVQVMPRVRAQLRGVMYGHGEFRGGPLFGKSGPAFEVHQAHLSGYSSLLKYDPLTCSPEYLLGLTDAYQQCQPDLDWIGHWLTWPDRQLPAMRETLGWLENAHDLGLVTEECGLLIIGWHDGQLCGSTAFADGERGWRWLNTDF